MDKKPTILIIDDDPRFRKTLSDIVRLQGYAPLGTAKGKTALSKVKKERPAVALIDLKLPDMDGLEVMEKIKKRSPARSGKRKEGIETSLKRLPTAL